MFIGWLFGCKYIDILYYFWLVCKINVVFFLNNELFMYLLKFRNVEVEIIKENLFS